MISNIPRNTRKYPEVPGNTQEYPQLPKSKKDTQKYQIVYFNTPTRPDPTRYPVFFPIPDPILKNPNRWALLVHLAILEVAVLCGKHTLTWT